MDSFRIDLADGRIVLHAWAPPAPRAVLHIIHGMAEHGARYARLGHALAAEGIAVYAQDLPGHGLTPGPRGHLADTDGWRAALGAIADARAALDARHPGLPRFMLGHSMGSFLMQHVLREQGDGLAGVVLSATTGSLGALRPVGLALLRIERALRGARTPSRLGKALGFSGFNRAFAPARTDFDWLSRDTAEVDAYIADPLCGFDCSNGLWCDLLAAGAGLDAPKRLAAIPKALPVLLIAGDADPVCQGGRGSQRLAAAYRRAGLADVTLRIWPQGRHELLNDLCRDEVTATLADWLRARLPATTDQPGLGRHL